MTRRQLNPMIKAKWLAKRSVTQALEAIHRKPAPFRNGVGAFVYPCRKLVLNYCERSGSSRGMLEYLMSGRLQNWAKEHPQVEVHVQPAPSRHPQIKGFFNNGNERSVCTRKLTAEEVEQSLQDLTNTSGQPDFRHKKPVLSNNPSVRGIWSPFHTQNMYRVALKPRDPKAE